MTCDFTSFSTVLLSSGRWEGDNDRLCTMEPHLWLERFLPPAGLKLGTARSAGQCLTKLTGLLDRFRGHWITFYGEKICSAPTSVLICYLFLCFLK